MLTEKVLDSDQDRAGTDTFRFSLPRLASIVPSSPVVSAATHHPSSYTATAELHFSASSWYVSADLTGNSLLQPAHFYVSRPDSPACSRRSLSAWL